MSERSNGVAPVVVALPLTFDAAVEEFADWLGKLGYATATVRQKVCFVTALANWMKARDLGVYALGDVVSIPLALGKPLPKAGVFAHGQAEVVAKNIADVALGRAPTARFLGHGECFVEIGDGKAGRGGGDFYAEPRPVVSVYPPSRMNHWGKVLFEKDWLWRRLR